MDLRELRVAAAAVIAGMALATGIAGAASPTTSNTGTPASPGVGQPTTVQDAPHHHDGGHGHR